MHGDFNCQTKLKTGPFRIWVHFIYSDPCLVMLPPITPAKLAESGAREKKELGDPTISERSAPLFC